MLNFIWVVMILASVAFSIAKGDVADTSNALFEGGKTAVNITISLIAGMAFWVGITEVAKECGITDKITKWLKPVITLLFPKYKDNQELISKISLNITANMFGLSNAATPYGLEAMSAMNGLNKDQNRPTKGMILFVVINTASLQLLPTGTAVLRSTYGSENPFAVTVPIWIVSSLTLLTVIILCKIMERIYE